MKPTTERAVELYCKARQTLEPIQAQLSVQRTLMGEGVPEADAIEAAWVASLTVDELCDIDYDQAAADDGPFGRIV